MVGWTSREIIENPTTATVVAYFLKKTAGEQLYYDNRVGYFSMFGKPFYSCNRGQIFHQRLDLDEKQAVLLITKIFLENKLRLIENRIRNEFMFFCSFDNFFSPTTTGSPNFKLTIIHLITMKLAMHLLLVFPYSSFLVLPKNSSFSWTGLLKLVSPILTTVWSQ